MWGTRGFDVDLAPSPFGVKRTQALTPGAGDMIRRTTDGTQKGPPQTGALLGKVAIVTGAARGLGLTTAEAYLAAGAQVAVLDRDDQGLRRAAAELRTRGLDPLTIHVDIRNDTQVATAVRQVL